jgi:hypothetical protein
MPYRHAWLWVTVLLVLTVPAFWPNYLGKLGSADWQLHVHGVTAGLWVLLVIFQAFTIHHGKRHLHRSLGLASMLVAPLFLAGGLLVIASMATRSTPFYDLFAARLGIVDAVSVIAFAAFLLLALKDRRDVGLHAGWMLATVFPLINPTIGRLFPAFVPGLTIRSLDELPRFAGSVQLAQSVALGLALFLLFRYRRHGTPMLTVAVMLIVQSILFETAGRSAWWSNIHAQIGATSSPTLIAVGVVIGVVTIAVGWTLGGSSRRGAPIPA